MADWEELIRLIEKYVGERQITRAEFSRRAEVSPAQVSKILNRESPPGVGSALKIGRVLGLSDEAAISAAGLSKKKHSLKDALIEKAVRYLEELPPEEQEKWVNLIEMAHEQNERRTKNSSSTP